MQRTREGTDRALLCEWTLWARGHVALLVCTISSGCENLPKLVWPLCVTVKSLTATPA